MYRHRPRLVHLYVHRLQRPRQNRSQLRHSLVLHRRVRRLVRIQVFRDAEMKARADRQVVREEMARTAAREETARAAARTGTARTAVREETVRTGMARTADSVMAVMQEIRVRTAVREETDRIAAREEIRAAVPMLRQ